MQHNLGGLNSPLGVHFHSPNSTHPNLEDAVGYVEHRVGLAEEGQVEVVGPRVEDVPGGPNSIEKFELEFRHEKSLEFWLQISRTKKMFKNGWFRHVAESKRNLELFFKPKLEPKMFSIELSPC